MKLKKKKNFIPIIIINIKIDQYNDNTTKRNSIIII